MLKTGQFQFPIRLRRAGKTFAVISFIGFATVTGGLKAQSVTLAMADNFRAPQGTSPSDKTFSQAQSQSVSTPVHDQNAATENKSTSAADVHQESASPAKLEPVVIEGGNLRAEARADVFSLRAGYGHPELGESVTRGESKLPDEFAKRNEPGIAYIKASFSF